MAEDSTEQEKGRTHNRGIDPEGAFNRGEDSWVYDRGEDMNNPWKIVDEIPDTKPPIEAPPVDVDEEEIELGEIERIHKEFKGIARPNIGKRTNGLSREKRENLDIKIAQTTLSDLLELVDSFANLMSRRKGFKKTIDHQTGDTQYGYARGRVIAVSITTPSPSTGEMSEEAPTKIVKLRFIGDDKDFFARFTIPLELEDHEDLFDDSLEVGPIIDEPTFRLSMRFKKGESDENQNDPVYNSGTLPVDHMTKDEATLASFYMREILDHTDPIHEEPPSKQ